jgi:hypothetical protein
MDGYHGGSLSDLAQVRPAPEPHDWRSSFTTRTSDAEPGPRIRLAAAPLLPRRTTTSSGRPRARRTSSRARAIASSSGDELPRPSAAALAAAQRVLDGAARRLLAEQGEA